MFIPRYFVVWNTKKHCHNDRNPANAFSVWDDNERAYSCGSPYSSKNGSGLAAESAFTNGDYGDQFKDVFRSESAHSRFMTGLS